MDGDTVTPTPEPGQRYLLEVECVPSTAGHPMLTPIAADGQPSTIRLAAARYRWQPVDVPPQPPVLDDKALKDAVRHLSAALIGVHDRLNQPYSDMPELTPWTRFISPQLLELRRLVGLDRGPSSPLADVPDPDDTTPTPDLATSTEAPDLMAALQASLKSARAGRERRQAVEPPPAGEGAALIAATEQEIAAAREDPEYPCWRQRDAWEAAARRACAKLDELVRSVGVIRPWLVRHGFPAGDTRHLPQQAVDALEELHGDVEAARQAPVQAATHGEAGEAQEGAEGAAEQFNLDTVRCPDCGNEITGILNEGDSFPRHKSPTTPQGCPYPSTRALIVAEHFTRRRKPAVQGAGRDWREIVARVIAEEIHDYAPDEWRTNAGRHDYYLRQADKVLAVLGLHDLEQAAAERDAARHNRDQIADTLSRTWDAAQIPPGAGAADLPEVVRRIRQQREDYREAHVRAWAERDSARRELEQLRGEVERLRGPLDWLVRLHDGPRDEQYERDKPNAWQAARAALAEWDPLAARAFDRLAAERDEALAEIERINGQSVKAVKAAAREAEAAARRELEQLRGDVSAIAHDCAARAAIPAGKAIPPDLWYTADRAQIAERLRAALAATAPATQDGDPK